MEQVIDKESLNLSEFYRFLRLFDVGTEISNSLNDLKTLQFSIDNVKKNYKDFVEVTLCPDAINKNVINAEILETKVKNNKNAIIVKNNVERFYNIFCNSILSEDYSILIIEKEKDTLCIQIEHYLFNYKKVIIYKEENEIIIKALEINIPCSYYNNL